MFIFSTISSPRPSTLYNSEQLRLFVELINNPIILLGLLICNKYALIKKSNQTFYISSGPNDWKWEKLWIMEKECI